MKIWATFLKDRKTNMSFYTLSLSLSLSLSPFFYQELQMIFVGCDWKREKTSKASLLTDSKLPKIFWEFFPRLPLVFQLLHLVFLQEKNYAIWAVKMNAFDLWDVVEISRDPPPVPANPTVA